MAQFVTDLTPKMQSPGTSIADMVNLARGVQQYKQAEQINPLQVQQEQAKTQKSAIELNDQKTRAIANSQISMINNPLIVEAERNPSAVDPAKLTSLVRDNGMRIAKDLGIDPRQAESLLQPYIEIAQKDPQQLRNYFKQRHIEGLDQASKATTLGGIGAQPAAAEVSAPTVKQQQPTEQKAPVSETSNPVALPYPVRQAGVQYTALPQEEDDRKVNTLYRNNLVSRLPNMATERRNIDETIKVARELEESVLPTSGVLGAVRRKVATWAGDPTYIELSKNLANITLSNMQALGLRTDADKTLSSAANGDYTYPPEILIKIAERAKADMRNIELQAQGAEQFTAKFGDNNLNAFKQMWQKNSDTKIFQAMDVYDRLGNTPEAQKEIDKILGKDQNERKRLAEKYENIKKLTATGTL